MRFGIRLCGSCTSHHISITEYRASSRPQDPCEPVGKSVSKQAVFALHSTDDIAAEQRSP